MMNEKNTSDIGTLCIVLKVKDVRKSAEFYKKLGFLPEHEATWNEGYASFNYQGTSIALMDFIPQEVLLVNLEQKDQASVDALGERLKGDGIPVGPAGPPGSGNSGLTMQDPDGHTFFIFTNAK